MLKFKSNPPLCVILINLLIASCIGINAQEAYRNALCVQLKNGTQHYYLFSTSPQLTFEKDRCNIESDETRVEYAIADISQAVTCNYSGSGMVNPENDDRVVIDMRDPDTVIISGLSSGSRICLYDLGGVMLRQLGAADGGIMEMSLSGLPSKVYILSVNQSTFKIYKK